MKLDEHSPEARFSRSAATQSPRRRNINPRTHPKEEIVQPIRRKRAADSARSAAQSGNAKDLEVADHEYNESTFPFRQRTNSTTSIDTARIRSTSTKLKNDTDVVAAPKSAPRNSIPSPTSFKQGSKQKSSFQSITTQSESTSLLLSTVNAKAPRKKKSKKSGNGPVPKSLPTIINVGNSSLLVAPSTTTVTIATATHSDFSLDDLSSWNMDTSLSSSSPDSPVTRSNTPIASPKASYSAPSDAPFSTPYDEDALLESEVPFPFNKHAGVIIENMGVKKAKNLNKGKESLLNRHITTVRPDLYPPHSNSTLPLSLRSLSPNTTNLDPLADNIPHTTTPRIPVAPLSSTKDAWGCIHLGPADCELSIAFPKTSHFEIWDMDDEAFFACPLFLCLMAKDPRLWTGTPISLPDVSLVDIRCDDLPVPSSMSVYDPSIEYAVHCTVPQNRAWNRNLPPYSSSQKTEFPYIVNHNEITIEGKWQRIYTKPKMEGQTPILCIAADSKDGGDADGTMMNERGWYLKIWIPIPARLFMKRETRIFEVRASVWMMMRVGGERRVLNLMDPEKEVEEDFPLMAETEMTVSHLRRERDMMMW